MKDEQRDGRDQAQPQTAKLATLIGVPVVVIAVMAAVYLWPSQEPPLPVAQPEPVPVVALPAPDPVEPEVVEAEPVAQELTFAEQAVQELAEPEEPLPPLNGSDEGIKAAVRDLTPDQVLAKWLVPEEVIRKFVLAVDNMSQGKLARKYPPIAPPQTPFVAHKQGDGYTMAVESYHRYDHYVVMLDGVDKKALVTTYRRFYPLLQEAYLELGRGNTSFHSALLGTVDNILAAPVIEGELALVSPAVMFRYADPELEKLPATHKLMLRMGPGNTRRVQQALRELRAELTR